MLPQVVFAYNATRAPGVEHTPFKSIFGFSLDEPLDIMFNMRPSILICQHAIERLQQLRDLNMLARSVLHLHKDEMQART
jgi:hypothetical protein